MIVANLVGFATGVDDTAAMVAEVTRRGPWWLLTGTLLTGKAVVHLQAGGYFDEAPFLVLHLGLILLYYVAGGPASE